ncbi:hypothetical protein IGI04_003082 [Brassica rapa subsp. trilocularis]|uniref:Protein FAR1-RELATED SEQUENCE n=1 Tax=Brassica rapa subsp. trilocularis TaxID=1813537 RepID=A0ABQ7NXE4_BRACM|nr:hypothetical protein IGI04_003082 [Brassica rapa subsp. trilocularis]
MDIDLRLHSGDQGDDSVRGLDNVLHNSDIDIGKIEEDVLAVTTGELVDYAETVNLEPLNGMEFDSHGEAYAFYQEYSRAIGFNTAIQNSRRSKTTREFIDAKFACSRYGTKREYENKSCNRPRARQSKQDHPENHMAGGCRRTCAKTDCKASMHVKRRSNGKWVIHSFVREHNHELVPAQAVTEQARRIYAAMAKQFAEYKTVVGLKSDAKSLGRNFARRWWKILAKFGLKEDQWMQSLYEDRRKWAPTYMTDVLLAGMSSSQRGDSVNAFLDKYLHKKTSVQEFVKLYDTILQDRFEEEAKADSETLNKQPTMKSPSPFEKSVSEVYTPAVFKKFQVEVLGAIACSPREENRDGTCSTFRVQDFENSQEFVVTWNQAKAEVSCICRLFEYKGYLCRHTLNVLQCCHLSSVPSQYILKRWTKDARSRQFSGEAPPQLQTRMQRYNDLCQRALKLSEEASCSQESYNVAFLAIEEALRNCAGVNRSLPDTASSPTQGLVSVEEDNQSRSAGGKTSKKKNPTKKRKVSSEQEVMPQVATPESLQQMDKLSPRTVGIESYYGTQQSVQTMVQLDLMGGPNRDNFYGNQQTMQGLRQLNSIAPSYDSYYTAQQGIHGQGVDFFRPPNFSYDIRDDPNVRTTQLHEDAPRHS